VIPLSRCDENKLISYCEISSSHGGEYDVQYAPLKRQLTIILHSSIFQKTTLNINLLLFLNVMCEIYIISHKMLSVPNHTCFFPDQNILVHILDKIIIFNAQKVTDSYLKETNSAFIALCIKY
jgi:hypothetical protein